MRFKVHAVPPEQFAAWARSAQGQGQILDARAYSELVRPSSYVKPITYGAVAPGLFESIIANRAPPPMPPETTPPEQDVSPKPPAGAS
jgi:cytochrome o ubiquinol oxidase subunit 2